MAETSYPWTGDSVTQGQWEVMAPMWARKGVIAGRLTNDLAVDSLGSNADIRVNTGACWYNGHYYENSGGYKTIATTETSTTVCAVVDFSSGTSGVAQTILASAYDASVQLKLATIVLTGSSVTSITDNRVYCDETSLSVVVGTGYEVPATGDLPTAIPIPFAAKITRWEMAANAAGTVTLAVKKYSGISAWVSGTSSTLFSANPTMTSLKGRELRVSASNSIIAGDYLQVRIESITTITQVVLTLYLAPLLSS